MNYFSESEFMPHGHCYLWNPLLVWTHVTSDFFIGSAYFGIAVLLFFLVKRVQIPFSAMVVSFGVFIAACGATHYLEIWNLWHANYWVGGGVKILTAWASVVTCLALLRMKPRLYELANSAKLADERLLQLEHLTSSLEQQVDQRTQELSHSLQLRDNFISIASHELRTPLTSLRLENQFVQRALEKGRTEVLSQDHLKQVFNTSARQLDQLTRLVEDMLDGSRISAGTIRANLTSVDFATPIFDSLKSLAPQFEQRAIEVISSIAPGVLVLGDPFRLGQLITNLLTNAVKYGEGKPIQVTMNEVDGNALLTIEDNGMGISADHHKRIFERFERAVSHKNISGLGLGLFICREIVDQHHGKIWVESAEGAGAKFFVSLPLV